MKELKDLNEEELIEKIHEAINNMEKNPVCSLLLRLFSSDIKPISEEDKNRLVNEFKESIKYEK